MTLARPMTSAERVRATYAFQSVDHLVRREFYISPTAIERWINEGMLEDYPGSLYTGTDSVETLKVRERFSGIFSGHGLPCFNEKEHKEIMEWLAKEKFNYDPPGSYEIKLDIGWEGIGFFPPYEEKVLYTEGDYDIIQDIAGSKLKVFRGQRPMSDEFMPTYLESVVSCKQKWERDVKPRLDPAALGRYDGLEESCNEAERVRDEDGTFVIQGMTGAYNYLRRLLGPEGVLYAFYDQQDMIRDMLKCWTKLMDASLERIQALVELDEISLAEDICYKNGPLISPKMFRKFLTLCYSYVISRARVRQKRHLYVHVDSDGYVLPIINLYLEMGFDAMSPWEVAAGNDVVKIGQKYPNLVMPCGGIDKRVLAEGKQAIDRHLEYIIPSMLKRGGYIPTCDHGIPATVSWEDYLYYRKRICELDH